MKHWDFCIGNPAYQAEQEGQNEGFAAPVYDKFLDAAYEIADKVEMIHPARFLFNAGSTKKAWNEKMLTDPHLKVLHYEEDASKVFSNTDIKGGIAITYRDRNADYGAIEVFTKHDIMRGIVKKVQDSLGGKSLADIVFTQCRFDLPALYNKYPYLQSVIGSKGKDKRFRNNIFDKVDIFYADSQHADDIPTLGVVKNKRVWRFIDHSVVDQSHECLNKWKVLIARANGTGQFGELLSTPVILKPGEAYTQTFIGIGAFNNEAETNCVVQYLKTKFLRAMLGVLKVTQDNDREVWRLIPLQDFTSASDIDWSRSIAEIDQQLYKKYGLTDEEIQFIETHVKEMN